jgi:opacity protein-like surface antigen
MKRITLAAVVLVLMAATTAEAQVRGAPARSWAALYGQMYTGISRFYDPDTQSDWVFDDNAFGFGAALMREVTPGLLLGADVGLARTDYERRERGSSIPIPEATGTATIATALLTGRVAYGGATELGFYLTGGLGTIAYRLEDLGEWNADFALRAGTGLEYRMAPSRALYLEWARLWGYHEREGIGGGAAQHSVLQLGLRFGL